LAFKSTYEEFLNSFTNIELGEGVWVKLASNATLTFDEIKITDDNKNITLSGGEFHHIAPLKKMTLSTIKSQVGANNLEVIQCESTTFQKAYILSGESFLNTFISFGGDNRSCWIKLENNANLQF